MELIPDESLRIPYILENFLDEIHSICKECNESGRRKVYDVTDKFYKELIRTSTNSLTLALCFYSNEIRINCMRKNCKMVRKNLRKIEESLRKVYENKFSTNFSGSYSIKSSIPCPLPKNKIGFLKE